MVQWVKAVATKPDNQNQSLGSTWLEVGAYSHRLTSNLHTSSLVCRWAGMLTHKHTHMHTHTELNTVFSKHYKYTLFPTLLKSTSDLSQDGPWL